MKIRKLIVLLPLAFGAILLSSCSKKQYRQDDYIPSAEILKLKSDIPVDRIWNRWDDQFSYRSGDRLIQTVDMSEYLANDPSPAVMDKVRAARAYSTATTVSSIVGLGSVIGALSVSNDHMTQNDYNTRAYFVGGAVVGYGLALLFSQLFHKNIEEGVELHNQRLQVGTNGQDINVGYSF